MFHVAFVLVLPASVYGIGQPNYECGEFGRFEYCIDDVPSCVVGCHCHPGYYFDTETKICEPNSKLVHEYRRQFSGAGPTRVPDILLPVNEQGLEPTPTTTSVVDRPVDNIAKDSDVLGDWLYNQFFKTIETSVINNTDVNYNATISTRRANLAPKKKSRKRNQKKKSKGSSKKDKKKRIDLRRKLLRITEDDSLFDSSSGSDESETSESESDDSESESSEEVEEDNKKEEGKNKGNDNHGHRKVIMVNKKKRPPLPSFIFLPNLETPFFPPLGLPPAVMPMYPIVPVPPVSMPLMPPPPMPPPMPPPSPAPTTIAPIPNNESGQKKKEEPPHEQPKTDHESEPKKEEDKMVEATPEDNNTTDNKESESKKDSLLHLKLGAGMGKGGKFTRFKGSRGREERKKMLKQLREQQMKAMSQRKMMQSSLPDTDYDYDSPLNEILPDPDPPPEKVDFKYIAQLIHKSDNKSVNPESNDIINRNNIRKSEYNALKNYRLLPSSTAQKTVDNNRHLDTPDELYYSSLGHQIASLIRKFDARGDQKVNIEIERQDAPKVTPDSKPSMLEQTPLLMETRYMPHSFWDRSVRSLLSNWVSKPQDGYLSQKINENSLFNLESKVEIFATTARPLSLNDLENVVVLIDKTKSELQKTTTENPKFSTINDGSLNINLLPQLDYDELEKNKQHTSLEQKTDINNQMRRTVPNKPTQRTHNHSEVVKVYKDNKAQSNLRRALFQSLRGIDGNFRNKVDLNSNSQNGIDLRSETKPKHGFHIIKFPQLKNLYSENVTLNKNDITSIQRMVGATLNQVALPRNKLPNVPPWLGSKLADILNNPEIYHRSDTYLRQPLEMQFKLTPVKHKYQSNKYIENNNNNRFVRYKGVASVPLVMKSQVLPLPPPPSKYFHHEIQHFDMLDE